MKILRLVVSLIIPFVAGSIGNLATLPNLPGWYAALEKPSFNPPNWVFGPVWTTLYVLMGIALWLVWISAKKHSKRRAYWLFGAQLVFNALWSIVFFGLHAPWLALGVLVALFVVIVATAKEFRIFSPWAAILLIPYAAWVMFAGFLNTAIAVLN